MPQKITSHDALLPGLRVTTVLYIHLHKPSPSNYRSYEYDALLYVELYFANKLAMQHCCTAQHSFTEAQCQGILIFRSDPTTFLVPEYRTSGTCIDRALRCFVLKLCTHRSILTIPYTHHILYCSTHCYHSKSDATRFVSTRSPSTVSSRGVICVDIPSCGAPRSPYDSGPFLPCPPSCRTRPHMTA